MTSSVGTSAPYRADMAGSDSQLHPVPLTVLGRQDAREGDRTVLRGGKTRAPEGCPEGVRRARGNPLHLIWLRDALETRRTESPTLAVVGGRVQP